MTSYETLAGRMGQTDPGDSAILYAISSEKHGLKGVLVNAYGIYSNPITDEMLEKLEMKAKY